eukprot:jgi/Tetstr1/459930/TSEL_005269.t1
MRVRVEWEYYIANQKKSVAWFTRTCACTVMDNLEPDGATKTCMTSITSCCPSARIKPNGQKKLKNLDKQLAKQALERMRGGHPQQGATAPTASASASAASAATAAATAEAATEGA